MQREGGEICRSTKTDARWVAAKSPRTGAANCGMDLSLETEVQGKAVEKKEEEEEEKGKGNGKKTRSLPQEYVPKSQFETAVLKRSDDLTKAQGYTLQQVRPLKMILLTCWLLNIEAEMVQTMETATKTCSTWDEALEKEGGTKREREKTASHPHIHAFSAVVAPTLRFLEEEAARNVLGGTIQPTVVRVTEYLEIMGADKRLLVMEVRYFRLYKCEKDQGFPRVMRLGT